MKFTKKQPRAIEKKEGCIAGAMAIIGNKWTALILRDLSLAPKRFGELAESLAGISPRTLSQRLDDLEAHQIIERQKAPDAAGYAQYALTSKGRDLLPVLRQMAAWGEKYYGQP